MYFTQFQDFDPYKMYKTCKKCISEFANIVTDKITKAFIVNWCELDFPVDCKTQ